MVSLIEQIKYKFWHIFFSLIRHHCIIIISFRRLTLDLYRNIYFEIPAMVCVARARRCQHIGNATHSMALFMFQLILISTCLTTCQSRFFFRVFPLFFFSVQINDSHRWIYTPLVGYKLTAFTHTPNECIRNIRSKCNPKEVRFIMVEHAFSDQYFNW